MKSEINNQLVLAFRNILSYHRQEDIYSEKNPDVAYNGFLRTFCKANDTYTSFPEIRKKIKTKSFLKSVDS